VDLLYQCAGGHRRGARDLGIYHKRETPTAKVPVDTVGLALLVIWVGALQVLLDQAGISTGSTPQRLSRSPA